jgi:hypothetical protein
MGGERKGTRMRDREGKIERGRVHVFEGLSFYLFHLSVCVSVCPCVRKNLEWHL